ncbi:MAG: hypothetical protein AB4911_23025 [Oscillochloridaceae bacterium umkhey_bin13]
MSRTSSALVALACLAGLTTLLLLLGAATPAPPSATALPVAALVAEDLDPIPSPELAPTELPLVTATPIPPTPTLARREFNESVAMKVAPTAFLPGRGPALPGQFVTAGRRLDFYVGRSTYSTNEVAEMAIKAEHALSYIQKRFAVTLSERVSVGIYHPSQAPGRGTRGVAYTYGDTNVRIYYRSDEDQHKALVILVHELAHALQAEAYGKDAQSRSDTILLEGMACWITGEYWLTLHEAGSFHSRARELYQAGYAGGLASMGRNGSDVAYDMWAGFVDYLARTYGWDKLNRAYLSGRGRAPGSADYMGVYGKSFRALQEEFYATLK